MESPFKGKTGLRRLINATGYSFEGFKAAYQNEDAFRQEVLLAAVLIPLQIRDIHHGGAGAFALMNIAFWSGSITSNLILMRTMVLRRGRACS